MRSTRFKLGKGWKQGVITGDYEKYYLEFKDEIDNELNKKPEVIEVLEEKEEIKNKKKKE